MQESSRQFKQIIRTYAIRSVQITRQKSTQLQTQQSQQNFIKILQLQQSQQSIIANITSYDLKTQFHQILLLALLQQLAKWSIQYYQELKKRPHPIQTLIARSITLIESQQKFHQIVSKQNQLISNLLLIPHTIENIEHFKNLYRKLKDIKDFYPSTVKDSQRILFSKTIQQVIPLAIKFQAYNIIDFIHNNICTQIEILEDGNDMLPSRLKILKKILKSLTKSNQQIQKKTAYIVLKLSHNILQFPFVFGHLISLYQLVLQRFTKSDSLVPMILFQHVIIQNLTKAQNSNRSLFIDVLLHQISFIFSQKLYDWNFMAQGTCRKIMHLVFTFTEQRQNQKKPQYQFYKRCLKRMMESIQKFVGNISDGTSNEQRQTFYFVKKREYDDIIQMMNNHPKKVYKKLGSVTDQNQKQNLLSKYVHVLRRSAHLQQKSMVQIMAADNKYSRQIFNRYIKTLMAFCQSYDLQQFMRHFISNFFLSGEGQQVQRTIDYLTQYFYKYQKQQQAILKHSDAAYTFANAIIILNSDLHNPKNDSKMTQQAFIKICRKINAGQDLPLQILKTTYKNVKYNQIHTYRDLTSLKGISYKNWIILIQDPQITKITYYDQEMNVLQKGCFQTYVKNMLLNIINQKQDKKLALMVQRFDYNQKNFQCQIIQDLRKAIQRRPQLPSLVLQKIYQQSNFRNTKINDKIISYYWLAVKIIQTFQQKIHPKKICQLLVLTWRMRMQLGDHLYTRQKVQIKKIKNCLKDVQSRGSRKSIIDIFSNFLSKQDSDQQTFIVPKITKKVNYQGFGLNIMDVLQNLNQCKKQAIQYLISYLKNNESKIFQEFISILSLIMNLIHTSSSLFDEYTQLFEQLLEIKETQLSKRFATLKQKDNKKYLLLNTFSKYWILRILFKKLPIYQKNNQIFQQTLSFIDVADRVLMIDIINQLKLIDQIPKQIVSIIHKNLVRIIDKRDKQQIQWFVQKYPPPKTEKSDEEIKLQKKKSSSSLPQLPVKEQTNIKNKDEKQQTKTKSEDQNKQNNSSIENITQEQNQKQQQNFNENKQRAQFENEQKLNKNQIIQQEANKLHQQLLKASLQNTNTNVVQNLSQIKNNQQIKNNIQEQLKAQLGNQNLDELLQTGSEISLPFYML